VAAFGEVPRRHANSGKVGPVEGSSDNGEFEGGLIELVVRVHLFPPDSTLSRVDATGLSANDLNALRSSLATSRNASSSVLVDDGPRRWFVGVS